jgi:hypothetical protein
VPVAVRLVRVRSIAVAFRTSLILVQL